jgi:hypothetical protein
MLQFDGIRGSISSVHFYIFHSPTTQSGVGPNIDTNESLLCLRSTRKCDDVFELTFGYHKPPAFIKVRKRPPFALNSSSSALGDPLFVFYIKKVREIFLSLEWFLMVIDVTFVCKKEELEKKNSSFLFEFWARMWLT